MKRPGRTNVCRRRRLCLGPYSGYPLLLIHSGTNTNSKSYEQSTANFSSKLRPHGTVPARMYLQFPHVPSQHHCVSMSQPAFESSSTRADACFETSMVYYFYCPMLPWLALPDTPNELDWIRMKAVGPCLDNTKPNFSSSPPTSPCLSGSRSTSQHTLRPQGRWPPHWPRGRSRHHHK